VPGAASFPKSSSFLLPRVLAPPPPQRIHAALVRGFGDFSYFGCRFELPSFLGPAHSSSRPGGYLPSLILPPLVNPECSAAPASFPARVISGEEEGNRRESRLLGTRIASIRLEEAYGRPNRISWEQ